MKVLKSKSISTADVQDANFSEQAINAALNRSDVEIKPGHIYVYSVPQKCHGEKNKREQVSNRIIMTDVNKAVGTATIINMPYSTLQAIFIAAAAEWDKHDRIPVETRYVNDDRSKPYLRPDVMYTPATENGNIQFDPVPGEQNMQMEQPFALECLGVIDTISARYDTRAPKLHGNITPLVTFKEGDNTYAKPRAGRTPLFRRVSDEQLQALLAEDAIPSTKDALKAALSDTPENKKFFNSIEKYLL